MFVTVLPAVTSKVAILPLKAFDSGSKYIQKILTKRDLKLTFDKHAQYNLMDMKSVEKTFKASGYKDVEALEVDEMLEVANSIGSDMLIMGNVSTSNPMVFRVQMRLFSPKSKELKSVEFNVGKEKTARWKVLNDVLMVEVDKFISGEIDKMYNIAVNQFSTGNYAEAELSLIKVIELNPDKKDAYYTLGAAYNKQKKYEDAVRALTKCLELDPAHLQSLYTLSEIYEVTSQPIKRIEVLSKIAEINKDEELWLNIANLYYENNDKVRTEESLIKALALDPALAKPNPVLPCFSLKKASITIRFNTLSLPWFSSRTTI